MAGIKAFRSFECLTGRRVARPQLAGIGPAMNFHNRPSSAVRELFQVDVSLLGTTDAVARCSKMQAADHSGYLIYIDQGKERK